MLSDNNQPANEPTNQINQPTIQHAFLAFDSCSLRFTVTCARPPPVRAGRYHGVGAKLYSKGGGYEGEWRHGLRHGWGTSFYDGKWGNDRWAGPFEDDLPHGHGTMYGVDDPGILEFAAFDENNDGVLSKDEVVGRLCGTFGADRGKAEALFKRLEAKSGVRGGIDLALFCRHEDEIGALQGSSFAPRPDQRPVFEFDRGKPVGEPQCSK